MSQNVLAALVSNLGALSSPPPPPLPTPPLYTGKITYSLQATQRTILNDLPPVNLFPRDDARAAACATTKRHTVIGKQFFMYICKNFMTFLQDSSKLKSRKINMGMGNMSVWVVLKQK